MLGANIINQALVSYIATLIRCYRHWENCMPRSNRAAFTLVELLVVIAIIGVLVALLLPAVQAAREAARRTQCSNNLKQIGVSLHNHHDTLQHLPLGGDNGPTNCCAADANVIDRYSWTFHLLPYIEQDNLHEIGQTDRATLIKRPVAGYHCPSRRSVQLYGTNQVAKSDYAGCSGTGSNGAMVQSSKGAIGFRTITDGLSNTLIVAEARIHRGYIDNAAGSSGYWADNEDCYTNGWADDVIRNGNKTPAADLIRTDLAGSLVHAQFGSSHPGGMNGVLCDGSTRVIHYNVNGTLFRNLCSRNDGGIIAHGDL